MAASTGGRPPAIPGLGLEEVAELEAISSQPAYDAFLVPARELDPGAVEECRANIALAFHNVKRAVDGVFAQEAVVGGLPGVKPEELRALPQLAQGLAFAALQVQRDLRAGVFGPLFERAQHLRRKLFKAADALAEAGLLLDSEVDASRSSGRRDVIGDCGALAALFRRNEDKLAGRSPVTEADVGEAERVAEQLRAMLAPPDARDRDTSPLLVEAAATRDRFWTLLNQRYDVLWRCGAWLYGRDVDDRVPPLQARHALVRRGEAPVERVSPGPSPRRNEPVPQQPPSAREPSRASEGMERSKVRFLVRVGFDFPSR